MGYYIWRSRHLERRSLFEKMRWTTLGRINELFEFAQTIYHPPLKSHSVLDAVHCYVTINVFDYKWILTGREFSGSFRYMYCVIQQQ